MAWTKEELEKILQEDFIDNYYAFDGGRRNNDMVDSMCICFALDREWTEMWAKHVDNYEENYKNAYGGGKAFFDKFLKDHYERVKKWLEQKEAAGYKRGETDIMKYAINY